VDAFQSLMAALVEIVRSEEAGALFSVSFGSIRPQPPRLNIAARNPFTCWIFKPVDRESFLLGPTFRFDAPQGRA
jgi:hypothetical protein